MTAMHDVFTDLVLEGDELDAVVAALPPEDWHRGTPAPGWTIAHQIGHLTFIADMVRLAVDDPAGFEAVVAPARDDIEAAVEAILAGYLADPVPALLARWREARAAAAAALAALPKGADVPWVAGPMPAGMLAAAGLMEVFAHGQDVLDALGLRREPTDRIGHVAWFGTRTRDFGYEARGLAVPAEPFRFELTAPSGEVWAFGPPESEERVTGPALDFCLLVTRRRHRDDLGLKATGDLADPWLDLAQAFPGPAGEGRRPGQFA